MKGARFPVELKNKISAEEQSSCSFFTPLCATAGCSEVPGALWQRLCSSVVSACGEKSASWQTQHKSLSYPISSYVVPLGTGSDGDYFIVWEYLFISLLCGFTPCFTLRQAAQLVFFAEAQ